jgi:alpha,alpha-trehalase
MRDFAPVEPVEGYLPIEDHGLIGDGKTSALVARDGSIPWMCLPRFDSEPLFCRILDRRRGGAFTVAPEGLIESRQYYEDGSAILATEMRGPSGLVRLTDAMTLHTGADLTEDVPVARNELIRSVEVLAGNVDLQIAIEPWRGAGAEPRAGGLLVNAGSGLKAHLLSSHPLDGLVTKHRLKMGDRLILIMRWGRDSFRRLQISEEDHVRETTKAWHRWLEHFEYNGPEKEMVRRSAITLKLLDHMENGAVVAAPTSSLPEAIGGPRNWDYRYAWIRDAAFSVYGLRRIGFTSEAEGFLSWVLDVVERGGGRPKVLYDVGGALPDPEREDPDLEGYRGSSPVRWGNGAAEQWQHDVFGEILDCAYQWVRGGGTIEEGLWNRLREFIEGARQEWRRPDHGIWEVRTEGRTFTYSAAMCQVALDRGARLAESLNLSGDIAGWRKAANEIREAILEEAWDPEVEAITEHLGGGGLDASLLTLPLRRVIAADHPKMVATTKAIAEHLGAGDGLIYRYLPDKSPDGLEGKEGAFLLCSFWLVDNLARQGRLEEAWDLYESLCSRAGPLGLLPEQIDPDTGAFLGNYPQAFSHVGVISSGVNLIRSYRQGSV